MDSSESVVNRELDGKTHSKSIPSINLVQGDFVTIQKGETFSGDILLIEGSCIVDESLVTGESSYVVKNKYKRGQDINNQNILLCGSKCVET